jgi:mRNA interferase HigB
MHVISRKALREFARRHPDSKTAVDHWFHLLKTNSFENFNSLRKIFPSADMVGDLIVFNIGGNKYRLVASIHFNRQKVYVRHLLTHEEYNRGKWKS